MQKEQDVKELFTKLPDELKKLVSKPQFSPKSFTNISLKYIDSLVNHVKTKTLISLMSPPAFPSQQRIYLQKCKSKPIVLVFCQPSQEIQVDSCNSTYPYAPVAYCSWLQSVGAKCIPLPYNLNEGSMQFLLERCNGLVVPGGGANLYKSYDKKEGYGPVTVGFLKIWRMIAKLWQKGVYFPVWGTCLGLEIILMAITNDVKILSNLNSRAHQLQVYTDYQNSSITSNMPTGLRLQIENRKLLNFQHAHGISVQKFLNTQKLQEKLKITGISKDKDGTWFCSLIEGKQNPIFLSQFHPEKQAFQWTMKGDILHQKYAVLLSQYFAEQFALHCLKNNPPKSFSSQTQLIFYMFQQYKQIHTPQKMYKVYAIDYKFRYVDKQSRKQLKNQKMSVAKQPIIKSQAKIGFSKKELIQKTNGISKRQIRTQNIIKSSQAI